MRTNRLRRSHKRTAVVVGASMAGLCAARVLSDRFDNVLVLDRDALPEGAESRSRVPQDRHPHLLLQAGARLLEDWFPGIAAELAAGGAIEIDLCRDFYWHQSGGVQRRPASTLCGPAMSRPFLERTVRRRVESLAGVTIRDETTAVGMATEPASVRVTGVRLADGTTVACSLLVDATGRQAKSLDWLRELGYEAPTSSEVRVDTRYVSRIYRRAELPVRDWKAAAVIGDPGLKRLAMVLPMEGDRWILTLQGLNGESAPTDDAGMLAYARSLESPVIADLMALSEPLGEPASYRFAVNHRRHVERMRRFPLGWVLIGDAVCSFDPIYGQGMTSAAMQAAALGQRLDTSRSIDRAFSRRYFRAVARTVNAPWSIAVGGDFVYDGTTGQKPLGADLVNRYMERVVIAGQYDDKVVLRFNEVVSLVRKPDTLLTPAFVVRVLLGARRADKHARHEPENARDAVGGTPSPAQTTIPPRR